MSYCICGGYLGSGGVDGITGVRWCRCAQPKMVTTQLITMVQGLAPTPIHIDCEPSEEYNRIRELEALLREIRNELSPFTHEDAILNVNVRIREILGE